MLGGWYPAGGELVVRALARQQRPRAADARSVVRASIGVLAVGVALVSMPGRAARRFHLQRGIDDFEGVQDARIVGCAKAEANEARVRRG